MKNILFNFLELVLVLLAISFFILTINFSSAEIINLENPTFDKDIFIPKNKTIEKQRTTK